MRDDVSERLKALDNPGLSPAARQRITSAIRRGQAPRGRASRPTWPWFAGSLALAGLLIAAFAYGPGNARPPGSGPLPASQGAGRALLPHHPVVKPLAPPNVGYPADMVRLPVVAVPMTYAVTSGARPRLLGTVDLALSAPKAPGLVAYAIWLGHGSNVAYFVGPRGLSPSHGGVGADGSWGVTLSDAATSITLSSAGGCIGCAVGQAAPYFQTARSEAAQSVGFKGATLAGEGVTANALDAYDVVFAYASTHGVTVASGVRFAPELPEEAGPGGAFFQETVTTSTPSEADIPVVLDEGLVQASGYPMHARTYAAARAAIIGPLAGTTSVPVWLPSSLGGRPVNWMDAVYGASKEDYTITFGVASDLPPNAPGLGFGNAEMMLTVEGAGPGGHLYLGKWIPLPTGAPMPDAARGTVSLGSGITGTTFTGTWEGQKAEAVRFTEHGWTVWVGPIPLSDGSAQRSASAQAKALENLTFPAAKGTVVFAWGQDAPSEAVFASGSDRYAVEALGWSAATDVARMAPVK